MIKTPPNKTNMKFQALHCSFRQAIEHWGGLAEQKAQGMAGSGAFYTVAWFWPKRTCCSLA